MVEFDNFVALFQIKYFIQELGLFSSIRKVSLVTNPDDWSDVGDNFRVVGIEY